MKTTSTQNLNTSQKYSTDADISSYSSLNRPHYVPKSMKELTIETRTQPKPTTSLEDEIDDLSEHYSFSKEDSFSITTLTKSVTSRGMMPTTPVPYTSNIQNNPFSRETVSYGFNSASKILEDEKNRLSFSPALLKLKPSNSNNNSNANGTNSNRSTINSTKKSTPILNIKKIKLIDCLTINVVLEKILSFSSPSDILNTCKISAEVKYNKEIQKIARKILKTRIIKGLSLSGQIDFWKYYVPFGCIKEMNACVFTSMALRESKFQREISKDVDRTLRDDPFFKQEKGRLTLYRVLIAISNTETEVGYIQGLNSVVGTLLLYLKEEDAYWMALYLLRKRELKKVFVPPFPKTDIWNYQLEIIMQNYLPDIFDHLTYKGQSIGYFSTPWFLTLYSHFLKTSLVIKIWNLYFLLGERIFIQVALAIFIYYKDALMRKDVDDLGEFFSKNLKKLSSEEELIKLALDFKVTTRLLNQIEGYYHKEIRSSRLVLECDHTDPLKMSFYEPSCNKSESGTKLSDKNSLVDSPVILINEKPISESVPQNSKKKESRSRKSLLGMLSKESSYPKTSYLKAPISSSSNKSSQLSSSPNSINIGKNSKVNESQNLEVEDLQNVSQSTETQTQIQSNIGKDSNHLSINSPQTLIWRKLDDLTSSEIKKKPHFEEDPIDPLLKFESQSQRIEFPENEIPGVKIPHFQKLKNVLEPEIKIKPRDHHSRQRSNSYTDPQINNNSFNEKNKTTPYPFTIASDSSSFLTDKPDDMENGYFDDQIKEELQRETAVFTPKFDTIRPNTQSFGFSSFDQKASEYKKLNSTQS